VRARRSHANKTAAVLSVALFLVLVGGQEAAMSKSVAISYAAKVGQLTRIFGRIYLTQLFGMPTDTLNWEIGGPRVYCVDNPQIRNALTEVGSGYAIKPGVARLPNELVAWPFKCLPIKYVAGPRSDTLIVSMLNLIDAGDFVRAVKSVAENNEGLTNYAMTKARYVDLFSYYDNSDADRKAELQQRVSQNKLFEFGLESIEVFQWTYGSVRYQFSASLALLDFAEEPLIEQSDHLTTITFKIRPFKSK